MRNYKKRLLALFLAVAMVVPCLVGCGSDSGLGVATAVGDEGVDSSGGSGEATEIADSLSGLYRSHGSEAGKEETVYVVADGSGNPTQTIVSAWLKNPEESDIITDFANLRDIENVKGDEGYTVDADGNLLWQADGNDIWYQGYSEEELPIEVNISYELDGCEVAADELEGADGHLSITFSYVNDTAAERGVGGETVTMYQPFVVASGLVLDNGKAANVTVDNGKVMASGDETIVVGLAFPGLSESLGLDGMTDADGNPVDIDIPESVTVEADVVDFSLLTTLTVASNSLLSEFDLDDVDSTTDLKAAMDELKDSSSQLVDGSSELYDGTEALSDGANELSDGVDALASGAGNLDGGAAELKNGADSLLDGSRSLSEGTASLSEGTSQLEDGAKDLAEGSATLSSGLSDLESGTKDFDAALGQLQTQMADLPAGVSSLQSGAATVKAALKGTDGHSIYEGAGAIASGAAAISGGAAGISTGLEDAPDSIERAKEGLDEAAGANATAEGYLEQLAATGLNAQQLALLGAAMQYMEGCTDGINEVSKGMDALSASLATADAALGEIQDGADAIEDGAESIQTGIDTMISGNDGQNLDALIDGLGTLSESGDTLVEGVDALAGAEDQLLDGTQSASSGAAALAEGSASLAAASGEVADGAASVSSGASQLTDGAESLDSGAASLKDGTSSLKSGASDLSDGAASLTDGIAELMGGASELMDGMAEFDEEGIQKLADLFEDDGEGLLDRLRALQDYAAEYTTFSGCHEDMPCTVKFVIRTKSIG